MATVLKRASVHTRQAGPGPADPTALSAVLEAAFAARQTPVQDLHAEDTNAYRLFNGSTENRPGLTVQRCGDSPRI